MRGQTVEGNRSQLYHLAVWTDWSPSSPDGPNPLEITRRNSKGPGPSGNGPVCVCRVHMVVGEQWGAVGNSGIGKRTVTTPKHVLSVHTRRGSAITLPVPLRSGGGGSRSCERPCRCGGRGACYRSYLSCCMRPKGPWQQRSCFHIFPVSCPSPAHSRIAHSAPRCPAVIVGLPDLLRPSSAGAPRVSVAA